MFKKILSLGVVLVVGLYVLCGCGGIPETDVQDMIELDTWIFTSGVPNNVITVHSERENVVFTCNVEQGTFWNYADQQYCKEVTLSPDEKTYWHPNYTGNSIKKDFVEIIVTENNNIIGYAVIRIKQRDGLDYSAEVLKSALFLNGSGEYQSVTRSQVEKVINKIKK